MAERTGCVRFLMGVTMLGLCLLILGCADHSHIHSYVETVAEASCVDDGYTLFTCGCGDSYKEDIVPALGHSYEALVIAPTYTSQGYTQYVCAQCGEEYKDSFTQMPPEVMSAMAIKDYLLPFEDFSRERKHNPEFVMIHFTSAVVLSKEDPYDLEKIRGVFVDYKVSVHYLIDRDGTVYCYIPEDLVAYHAGSGTWAEDPKYTNLLNDYAIGIEIAAIGSQNDMKQYMSAREYGKLDPRVIGYTDAQYTSLKALVEDICSRNQIPMDRQHIIGHQEYSPAKTDPGELLDWDRLLS